MLSANIQSKHCAKSFPLRSVVQDMQIRYVPGSTMPVHGMEVPVEYRTVKWTSKVCARLIGNNSAFHIQVNGSELTPDVCREAICGCLRKYAHTYLHERTATWSEALGISYNRLAIKDTKTRWGSCSAQGNLNLHWKLVLLPVALSDYVIVHELCHRRQMNHSRLFWEEVARVLPDYQKRKQYLREVEGLYLQL